MSDARLEALETMRLRFCNGPMEVDVEGTASMAPDVAALVASLGDDGTWPDVDYANDHLKDWAAAAHLRRLRALARSWQRPDSPVRGQPELLAAALRGLDGWYARNPVNPNWWWNQIGGPLLLGEALLHLKGTCERSYIDRAVPSFRCHEPIHRFTGQNLVWTATVAIYHGILTDAPDLVSQGFLLIGRETRTFPLEEGIQPDMSFYQHGNLLYSGGYGQGFASDVARLIAVADGTAYAWPTPMVDRFARFLLDGCRWLVRGRTFDPGATGREISRQGHSAARLFAGLKYLAEAAHTRQTETRVTAQADPAAGGSLVNGNRHFWCADIMVQHRPGYYCSIRVPSPRVWNNDIPCCGGEGRVCHFMADGATFFLRDGDEFRDLYPVWNWRQIPGTTVAQSTGPLDPEALRIRGERTFAGGASDGQVGGIAVDYARPGIAARKAWFLFDEVIVALGAGIACTLDAPVRTTLNQCHWRGPVLLAGHAQPLVEGLHPLAAGAAFWHDGIAWRILDGRGNLHLGPQSGAWSDCGVGSPEAVTLPVLNAGLEHGTRPTDASYAYAVYPDVSREAAFADDSGRLTIVRNTPDLQAVWHASEKRGHVVFYEPGAVTFPDGQRIASELPCILLYAPSGEGRASLTVAQPEQREGMLHLRLDGPVSGHIGVSLPVREYAGASTTLVCGR